MVEISFIYHAGLPMVIAAASGSLFTRGVSYSLANVGFDSPLHYALIGVTDRPFAQTCSILKGAKILAPEPGYVVSPKKTS